VAARAGQPRGVTAVRLLPVCAPAATPLAAIVQVAGTRSTVAECIETGEGEVGLDHYEVRTWVS